MENKKQFKIRVPESDEITPEYSKKLSGLPSMHAEDLIVTPENKYLISRRGIHERIQEKAVELGYDLSLTNTGYAGSYYFIRDIDSIDDYTEITWQDFLKLTPEDVEDDEMDMSIPMEIVKANNLSGNQKPKNNERNEKAWEIYKVVIGGKIKANDFNPLIMGKYVDTAYMIADEFLKQAGER